VLTRILLVIAVSYAIGCIAGAYYIMRLAHGVDIRAAGSGTAGARNALRVGGRPAAIGTFLFDVARGALAVIVARMLLSAEWAGALALAGVVVGHIWPAQLAFRGGKGLSVALGAMLVVSPLAVLIAATVGLMAGFLRRSLTVAALATTAFVPVAMLLAGLSVTAALITAAPMLLILIAHHPSFDRIRPPFAAAGRGLS
jgi:glycerol-3-phosphate acyltransferase PlsY